MNRLRLCCTLFLASSAMLLIAGCSAVTTIPTCYCGGVTSSIYLDTNYETPSDGPSTVLQYPAGASSATLPTNTIVLPANVTAGSLATDSSGNIYVATSSDVREYAAGSTGTATPLRTLPANATTTIGSVTGLAVDSSGNLYVSEQNAGVAVFSASANGSVAPSRYILGTSQPGGGLSTLQYPSPIAVDSSGNLYVVNEDPSDVGAGSILVFGPTATGNIAPIRTLSGALTSLTNGAGGIAVDAAGNLYATSNHMAGGSAGITGVVIFAPGAGGNVAPARIISGSSTQLGLLYGIAIDSSGDIYVETNGDPLNNVVAAFPIVLKFSAGATGNAAPLSVFSWQVQGTGSGVQVGNNSAIAVH